MYTVTIKHTTGQPIEEILFDDLDIARSYYENVVRNPSFKDALVMLLYKITDRYGKIKESLVDMNLNRIASQAFPSSLQAAS